MKLSNQRLLTITTVFNMLQFDGLKDGEPVPRKLPVKLGFAVRKNRKAIAKHLEDYNEERQDLLKEFCKVDKEGKLVSDPKTNSVEFKTDKGKTEFAEKNLILLKELVDVNVHMVSEATVELMGEIEEHLLEGIEFMIEGWGEDEEPYPMNGKVASEEDGKGKKK